MQFLTPLWLALGAAAAVPLLLHLWNRRRSGERVWFPAVRYLAAATEARGAAVRVRDWLLLALRVLAVALVALAAAQPSVAGRVGARAPAAIAIVLDNSLSTSTVVGGRSVLDALRAQLQGALAAATAADRLWLLTADGAVVAGDVATVRAALARVHSFTGAGDVPGALRRAAALAASASRVRPDAVGAVILATDAQATTWAHPVAVAGVRVGVVRAPGDAPPDRAVIALAAQPRRWSPTGTVVGRLTATGDWHLRLRDSVGRVIAEARGTATAGDSFAVRVPLSPAARGWLTGTLDAAPDELRGDDVRHLAVFVGAPPQLAVDASAGSFAAVAVATLVEGRAVGQSNTGTSARLTEPNAGTRLPAVLVAPTDPARIPAANRALDRMGVPWRFAAPVDAPTVATFRGGASVPVARRWRLAPRAAVATGDTVATASGEPWIVQGPGYVLLASPLDTASSPFPTRTVFLPWLAAAATFLADPTGVAADPRTAAPGAPVPVLSGADALLGSTGVRPVQGTSIAAPDEPGVYFWLRTGARIGALVVDPEAEEVVLARLDARELGTRIRVDASRRGAGEAGAAVAVVASGPAAAAFALGGGGQRALATLLAAAAALLLATEAVAARSRAPA